MPDLEGALPIILLLIFFWVRSIGAAMKKSRERQEQALERAAAEPAFEAAAESAFETEPSPFQPAGPARGEGPPPPRRPTLREQLRDMGRQLEQQMQQAAEEGRPGSMVGHVDPEEAPEPPPFIRPPPSTAPRRGPPREAPRPGVARPLRESRPPVVTTRRASARRGGPLARLERYPSLARAVILSEILGPPPGLSDDRGA